MGRLAKVMQGQSQPGLKVYKDGGKVATPFGKKMAEKSDAKMCGGAVKSKKK